MRVTVFWNKGRRDGRQAARRFFALSKSGGLTKSTSPIGQLKAASHDILQTGQTQIIAPHNPVVIRDSLCVAMIIKSLSGKSTSSSKNRVSDNVGPCQALLSALLHALKEERHFALVDGVAFSNRRLARNRFQARNSVRPMHLFGHNFDHDYYFELPCERGAGYPINYSVIDCTPSRFSGCPACQLGPAAREIS